MRRSYGLSLLILSSGFLLCLSVSQSEPHLFYLMSMDWTPIPIIVWFSIGLFTRRNSFSIIVALLNEMYLVIVLSWTSSNYEENELCSWWCKNMIICKWNVKHRRLVDRNILLIFTFALFQDSSIMLSQFSALCQLYSKLQVFVLLHSHQLH